MSNNDLASRVEAVEAALPTLLEGYTTLGEEVRMLRESIRSGQLTGNKTAIKEHIAPSLPSDATFGLGGKKYELLFPSVNIPGIGYRQADEILLDKEAQKALVEAKSGAVREVV